MKDRRSETSAKNLPPRDTEWKKKISLYWLKRRGYSEEEAMRKVEWQYAE